MADGDVPRSVPQVITVAESETLSATNFSYHWPDLKAVRRYQNILSSVSGRADLEHLKIELGLVINDFIARGYMDQKQKEIAERHYQTLKLALPGGDVSPMDDLLAREFKINGIKARRALYQQRLTLELVETMKNNGAILLDTLTVAPEYYERVFAKDSDEWRKYKQRVIRRLPIQNYFAVVERGEKNGRLHIHCLWFLYSAPPWRDPNLGLRVPINRTINDLNGLWITSDKKTIGKQDTIVVRYGGDVWNTRGWRWPVFEKRGHFVPIPSSPEAVISYCLKYVGKQLQKESDDLWRIRPGRNLGLKMLIQLLELLTNDQLLQVVRLPVIHRTRRFQLILVAAAKRVLQQRMKLRYSARYAQEVLDLITPMNMFDHSRSLIGMRREQEFTSSKTTSTSVSVLPVEGICDDVWTVVDVLNRYVSQTLATVVAGKVSE